MENLASNHWHEPVDIYCERLSPEFWAEPVNAITNLFFIMAAFLAFRLWKSSAARTWDMLVLALLMAVVGVGSFTFHTIATRWAGLADIIPIAVYIHFGLAVFLFRVMNAGLMASMLGAFLYLIFGLALKEIVPDAVLGRSGQYAPALLLLLLMTIAAYAKRVPSAKFFAGSFVVFFISLTFRSIDMQICEAFPLGVHFMWHVLNSVTMYLVYRGIISYSRISVAV